MTSVGAAGTVLGACLFVLHPKMQFKRLGFIQFINPSDPCLIDYDQWYRRYKLVAGYDTASKFRAATLMNYSTVCILVIIQVLKNGCRVGNQLR